MTGIGNRIAIRLSRSAFDLDVDVTFPERGITVLAGPSGSGKTTVLRCVAGLERGAYGEVRMHSEVWQDSGSSVFVPTWRRPIGYVFQEASLFEHLDVRKNLEFGVRRVREPGSKNALADAVELLGIGALLKRRPHELSGGERQRVAIARALATLPRLLLLDEPLSALDQARRHEILPWLEKIRDESGTPMLYVTHSVDEMARLADYVIGMHSGRVTCAGPTNDVFSAADTSLFISEDISVLIEGTVSARDLQWNLLRVDFDGGCVWSGDSGLAVGHPVRVRILARDVSITLGEPANTSIQNHFPGTIESIAQGAHPSQVIVRTRCGNETVLALVTKKAVSQLNVVAGMPVWLQVKAVAVIS